MYSEFHEVVSMKQIGVNHNKQGRCKQTSLQNDGRFQTRRVADFRKFDKNIKTKS